MAFTSRLGTPDSRLGNIRLAPVWNDVQWADITPPADWTTPQANWANSIHANLGRTMPAVVTTAGDMVFADGPHSLTRLPKGTTGQVLTRTSPTAWGWVTPPLVAVPAETPLPSFSGYVTSSGTIVLSGLPQTYSHLRIRLWVRTLQSVALSNVQVIFNGSSALNYSCMGMAISGAVPVLAMSSALESSGYLGQCPGATAPAGDMGCVEIVIPRYADAIPHTAQCTAMGPGCWWQGMMSWMPTTAVAITAITIYSGSGVLSTVSSYATFGVA